MVKVLTLLMHYEVDRLTNNALRYLRQQSYPHDIVVVDAGSSQPYETEEADVFRLPKSLGLAGSFNIAMERLSDGYDLVWHFTNDVEVSHVDTLAVLVDDLDYSTAAIQPAMPSSHEFLCPRGLETRDVPYVEWAAPLVSMTAWVDVGILDTGFNFFSMDIDWCHRAKAKGWTFKVVNRVACRHQFRGTHNELQFPISRQATAEDKHGRDKYGPGWQEFLKGGGK